MKLDKNQRKELGHIFLNLSQADFIALFIGRLVTPEKISEPAFVKGIILFFILLVMGISLSKGE